MSVVKESESAWPDPQTESADPIGVLEGTHFMKGDFAAAEGGLAAGCRFFGAYPITPATEVAIRMAERLPAAGGHFIQMEDEIASIASILGASNAGIPSMTSTSGPGFSLMLENYGLGFFTETPTVIVQVQRGGPSTGMPTLVGQGDVMQARWGSHGDMKAIVLAPANAQEMFDLTFEAFNLSEMFRTPVLVLSDQIVGHSTAKVTIPPADQLEVVKRRLAAPVSEGGKGLPFDTSQGLVPPMVNAGEGHCVHVTGLTHDERGYPVIHADAHDALMHRMLAKFEHPRLFDVVEHDIEGADIVVVSFGSMSTSTLEAVNILRSEGWRIGMLRPRILWPEPAQYISELSEKLSMMMVAEINYGQYVHPVRENASCPVISIPSTPGRLPPPEEVADRMRAAMEEEGLSNE